MMYRSEQNSECYFPPLLGNGDLSFAVDAEGTMHYDEKDFGGMECFDGVIYRAGRRLQVGHDRVPAKILSHGKMWFEMGAELTSWWQDLDVDKAFVTSECTYADGSKVVTESFIHPDAPVYGMRKVLYGEKPVEFKMKYSLCGYDFDTEEAIVICYNDKKENMAKIGYELIGLDRYKGEVSIVCEGADFSVEDNNIVVTKMVNPEETFVLWFVTEDSYGVKEYKEAVRHWEEKVVKEAFDSIFKENADSWAAYYELGYVNTPDEKLNSAYKTALYHLRVYATKWSLAIGINNKNWDGKFFAFDEYYMFLGLLGANRLELAKRVPAFRLAGLPKAINRATCKIDSGDDRAIRLPWEAMQVKIGGSEDQAHYPWETSEYGEEIVLPGYWMEHIFHMSVIALGAWNYYDVSRDFAFLKDCYPMIRACAKFFTRTMIYRDGERIYVGKCADLERLGSSRENAYMTSCGIISTMQVLQMASELLGIDEEYRAECAEIEAGLRRSLPVEEGRYVPYAGCPQKSIGVFAGKFPFDVLASDDEKLQNAMKDFEENGMLYGNMYKMGTKTSSWYAGWKGLAYARCGMAKEAHACLELEYEEAGVFDEMFEINEAGCRFRPWFTTASGILANHVNEMLIKGDGKNIWLLPACEYEDVSFKLAVSGGAVVSADIEGGELKMLQIEAEEGKAFNVYYKGEKVAF